MNPYRKTPVTYFLLWANIAIFIYMDIFLAGPSGGASIEAFVNRYALVPARFLEGAWWQPLTSIFLHGGYLHILVNMLALWSLGIPIEKTIGSVRFAWTFFLSALTGSFAVIGQALLFHGTIMDTPTLGASAGITGLLGALAILYPSVQLLVFFIPMKARTAAISFGIASLFFAFFDHVTNISHIAHLGGLLGGYIYTRFALGLEPQPSFYVPHFSRPSSGSSLPEDPFAPPSEKDSEDADRVSRILSRFREEDDRYDASGVRGPYDFDPLVKGEEKEIHPLSPDRDDNLRIEPERSAGPHHDPEGRPDHGERSPENRDEKRRLYYDPVTGEFYLK